MKPTSAGIVSFSFCVFTFYFVASAFPQTRPGWQAEWERTIAAAKREGQINIYPAYNHASIVEAGVFQKRYPEIKVVEVVVQGTAAVQRILSERRAGRYMTDVLVGGGLVDRDLLRMNALDPVKSALILPEVVDESKWWQGTHHYSDAERQYTMLYIGAPKTVEVFYNTKLVQPAKDLGSVRELLNPRWRGKILSYDPRGGGPGGGTLRFLYYHPKLGPEFIKRLFGETDMVLTRDGRLASDWLATGKFPICLVCNYNDVMKAKSQGLPVDTWSFGAIDGIAGLAAEGGSVSLPNRAPHPYAAKVFINWILSREGQITAQKALANYGSLALDSLRIDIPKDEIPPHLRRVEGVEYINLQDPSRLDMRPIFKMIEDVLREGKSR